MLRLLEDMVTDVDYPVGPDNPLRQVIVNGLYGLLLVVLFMVFQAPDVALSMLAVGSIAYPLVVLVAIARVRGKTGGSTERSKR